MAIVTKTYITKSNTITKDQKNNLGLNPIVELNYGQMVTRGIIYFDHTIEQRMNGTCAGGTGSFLDQMAVLLNTTTVKSILRLAAWIKWLPPIALMSPSPASTITLSSGLDILIPVAKAIALP